MAAAPPSSALHKFGGLLVTLSCAVFVRDNVVSTCRVKGRSMEPTLKDGDVVLVRKTEFTSNWMGTDDGRNRERARLSKFEAMNCKVTTPYLFGLIPAPFRNPPLILTGHVVVYKSSSVWNELCVKRVYGLGGQWLRVVLKQEDSKRASRQPNVVVPAYSMWVEGDDFGNSTDSRDEGPVSKKQLVGKAEYIVWPPSRIGKIKDEPIAGDRKRTKILSV